MRWKPGLLALLLVGAAHAGTVRAQQPREAPEVLRVITGTKEYCDQLSTRVVALRRQRTSKLTEADLLAGEGDRLCASGQIRPGIMRLRRAIMLLRGEARAGQ